MMVAAGLHEISSKLSESLFYAALAVNGHLSLGVHEEPTFSIRPSGVQT